MPKNEDKSLLRKIQEESLAQALPEQEAAFRVARRFKSRLNNLPDPTHPPLGFVKDRAFDEVFPFIRLPELRPALNGDWVQFGSPKLESNRLYYGDNLQVLRTLPSESIDLIYIDPPFFSGQNYNVIWGDTNEVRTFNDIWEGGIDSYLIWLNVRLWEMRRVLKSVGSIYVHCDWHAGHYIKVEMDKIFGYDNLRNEIVWCYRGGGVPHSDFAKKHDIILRYSKSDQYIFRVDAVRIPYSDDVLASSDSRYDKSYRSNKTYEGYRPNPEGKHPEDWWEIQPLMPSDHTERIGYPTQKPLQLLQRIIEASTSPGDVIADFFCGGGVTLAAAQGLRVSRDDKKKLAYTVDGSLRRRWIGCDISRVAISVTLNRLVSIGEEQSGTLSNYSKPGATVQSLLSLDGIKAEVPDIRVVYVGVYPIDRFKAVEQDDFERFVLECFDAPKDSSDEPITGWRNQLEPVLVGPANPEIPPNPARVKEFFEACLKHLQPNSRLKARVLAWKFSPQLVEYRKSLLRYISTNLTVKGTAMNFDFITINSQEFRERITRKYPDISEGEFLMRFTEAPIVAKIQTTKIRSLHYSFIATDAYTPNLDGYLVNCQWDFGYLRGHFSADREYVLSRKQADAKNKKLKGHSYEAVVEAEHKFPSAGLYVVACRVQDNLGGETIKSVEVEVR